jgi:hypothetical protein
MRFTEDRISHLAHLVIDALYNDDLVDYPDDDDQEALRAVKRHLTEYVRIENEAGEVARKKILSQSRAIHEGSREWDVLFRKYLEEEIQKRLP